MNPCPSVSRDHTRCVTALHRVTARCQRVVLPNYPLWDQGTAVRRRELAWPSVLTRPADRHHDTARGPGGPCSVAVPVLRPANSNRGCAAESSETNRGCSPPRTPAVSGIAARSEQPLRTQVRPSCHPADLKGYHSVPRGPEPASRRSWTRRAQRWPTWTIPTGSCTAHLVISPCGIFLADQLFPWPARP